METGGFTFKSHCLASCMNVSLEKNLRVELLLFGTIDQIFISVKITFTCFFFQSLISKGLHLNIVHAMKQHKDKAEVQRWGCRALRGLSLSGCGHKERLVNCGVLELVFSCAQR